MKYAALLLFCLGISGYVSAQEEQNRPIRKNFKVTAAVIPSQKKTTVNGEAVSTGTETPEKHTNVEGVVRTASCGTYVEVKVNGEVHRYFPTNLNREMQVDGYAFRFDYVDNPDYDFPEDCNILKAIQVNNVSPILNR